MDIETLPAFRWSEWAGRTKGPTGIGRIYLARHLHEDGSLFGVVWLHETPKGWRRPIADGSEPMPPPTRTPTPKPVRCSCGKVHTCSQCGEPTWIEFHGVADGECTYCWFRG